MEAFAPQIYRSHDFVLTGDGARWIAWNVLSGTRIAAGAGTALQVAGALFSVAPAGASGAEVRSTSTGAVVFATSARPRLEPTGAYAWIADATNLQVLSPTGATLFTHAGDYSSARVAAAPAELRIARSPAGAGVIETIAVPSGTSTTSAPFSGTFYDWFSDGDHFFTDAPGLKRIYTAAGVLADTIAPPSDAQVFGSRGWYWTYHQYTSPPDVAFYAIGGGGVAKTTATLASPKMFSAPGAVGFLTHDGAGHASIEMFDLGATAVIHTSTPPPLSIAGDARLAVDTAALWVVSNDSGAVRARGVVSDPTRSVPLSCGTVRGLAGAETGRVALTTSVGTTLVYDVAAGAKLVAALDVSADHVAITSDGAKLATRGYHDEAIRLIDVATGKEIHTWPAAYPVFADFALARGGSAIGRIVSSGTTYSRQITDATGATVLFNDAPAAVPWFLAPMPSPNGSMFAVPVGSSPGTAATRLYSAAGLVNGVNGLVVGWVGDGHLLVNEYTQSPGPPYSETFKQTMVYDAAGNSLGALAIGIRDPLRFAPATSTSFYYDGDVYDVARHLLFDGKPHLTHVGDFGAIAGNWFPYYSSDHVRVVPR